VRVAFQNATPSFLFGLSASFSLFGAGLVPAASRQALILQVSRPDKNWNRVLATFITGLDA